MTLKLDTLAYTNQLRRLPPEHFCIYDSDYFSL
jgi:hypothetical protein